MAATAARPGAPEAHLPRSCNRGSRLYLALPRAISLSWQEFIAGRDGPTSFLLSFPSLPFPPSPLLSAPSHPSAQDPHASSAQLCPQTASCSAGAPAMGPAEELVRIAKKLDKMVARKSTVRWPSSSGHVRIFTHIRSCTCAYLHTCLFTHVLVYKHVSLLLRGLGKRRVGRGVCFSHPSCSPWRG